jgi:hypothetical protein
MTWSPEPNAAAWPPPPHPPQSPPVPPAPGQVPPVPPAPGHVPPAPGQVPPGYGAPAPGYPPPAPGYPPPAWGPPSPAPVVGAGPQVRHRPGPGLAVGAAGLVLMLLSFIALPWVSQNGESVSLMDIRNQFEGIDPPSEVAYGVTYARWVWIVVLALAAVAVLTSAAFVPSSKAARIVIGSVVFAAFGLLGIGISFLANGLDERGVVGPRVGAGFLTLAAIALHVGAYVDLFTGDAAPDAALGVWAGFVGLVLVFTGCMMGTRAEPVNPWSR